MSSCRDLGAEYEPTKEDRMTDVTEQLQRAADRLEGRGATPNDTLVKACRLAKGVIEELRYSMEGRAQTIQQLEQELFGAKHGRDSLKEEVDHLRAMVKQHDEAHHELTALRDAAIEERDLIRLQMEESDRKRIELAAERNDLFDEKGALERELDSIRPQLEDAKQRLEWVGIINEGRMERMRKERDKALRAIMTAEPCQQVGFLNDEPVMSSIAAIDPVVERLLDIIERLVER